MPTRGGLDEAVAAGVIGRAEADRLADFLARREARPRSRKMPESIRFVRGFHDIFLTIGIVLLLVGAAYTAALFSVYARLSSAQLCRSRWRFTSHSAGG